eukprot:813610-Lingulodinium_polyedra.AAC.1
MWRSSGTHSSARIVWAASSQELRRLCPRRGALGPRGGAIAEAVRERRRFHGRQVSHWDLAAGP